MKTLSMIQWAGIIAGALVLNKLLKAKVGIVASTQPGSTIAPPSTLSPVNSTVTPVNTAQNLIKQSVGYDSGVLINPVNQQTSVMGGDGKMYPVVQQSSMQTFSPVNTSLELNVQDEFAQNIADRIVLNKQFMSIGMTNDYFN